LRFIHKVRDDKKKVKLDLWLEYFLHSGVMPHDLLKNVCIVSELCPLICQRMFLLYQSYAPWFAQKCLYCIRVISLDLPPKKTTMSCSISDLTEIHQIFNKVLVSQISFWFFTTQSDIIKKRCWYQDKLSLIGFTVNFYSSLLKMKSLECYIHSSYFNSVI
jgi:hypothetical protein